MRRFFASLIVVLFAASADAALPQYVNDRVVTNAVVDAFEFINNNAFYVNTRTVPWDAQNVTNWINNGVMSGAMGFRFDRVSPSGSRGRSAGFRNDGLIEAFDGGGFFFFAGTQPGQSLFLADSSYLTINASNIVNRGQLRVGASGIARVSGNNVDLRGSAILVEPLGALTLPSQFSQFGFFLITETNFFPDPGIYDQAWGIDISTNTFLPTIVQNPDPLSIITPPFRITNSLSWCSDILLLTNNVSAFVRAEAVTQTNWVFQIITVSAPTNLFELEAKFLPQTFPFGTRAGNNFLSPALSFTSYATDLMTDEQYPVNLFVIDQLGSSTNAILLVNQTAGTFRPAPIIVSRGRPFSWTNAPGPTDFVLDPSIIYNPAYSNQIVTNIYAAYGALIESTASRLPNIPDVGITNSPGRVEIQADSLNLRNTRIRAEGLASIKATNFLGSANAVLDTKHLQIQLNSGDTPIQFDNLSPDFVERFGGPLKVFSMVWTNLLGTGDTNMPSIEVAISLTAIDASLLHTREPSYVHDLALQSRSEIVMDDSMTISNRFSLSAPRVVINQRMRLEGSAVLDSGSVSNVNEFVITTNGTLSGFGLALYEKSPGVPLTSFENHGTLLASSHIINANTFASSGAIISTNIETLLISDFCYDLVNYFTNNTPSLGPVRITAQEARFDGGVVATAGEIILNGSIYKIRDTDFVASRLRLNATEALTDAGPDSQNRWSVTNGFTMTSVRPIGDLLGTSVRSTALPFALVEHTWAAANVGTNLVGFTNGNLALGQLTLSGGRNSEFDFLPAQMGTQNALYVDLLEIEGAQAASLTALANGIYIDPNFTIYYGDLRSTNAQITAESVNKLGSFGQGEGRMVWVPGFSGPNSSVDIARLDGRTERMNRALRLSLETDSDGDGIPNAFDPFPLDAGSGTQVQNVNLRDGRVISVPTAIVESSSLDSDGDGIPNSEDPYPFDGARLEALTVVQPTGQSAVIRFMAAPQTSFTIEFRDSLTSGSWQPLRTVTNTSSIATTLEVADVITASRLQRFYRVVYNP